MVKRAWGKRAFGLAVVAAAAAVMTATGSTHAATLVNDTWLDGNDSEPAAPTYSDNGVDADGDGNLETAWYQGGTGSVLDPVAAGGPLRGTVGATSASWTTYFTPEAAPVTLQPGDRLTVKWAFSVAGL